MFEHPLVLAAKAGARMMLQVALEEEVTDFLGRDYYERREDVNGYRSGSKPRTVKLSCGDITALMPQASDTGMPFHSSILPPYQTRMKELEEIGGARGGAILYLKGDAPVQRAKAIDRMGGIRLDDSVLDKALAAFGC